MSSDNFIEVEPFVLKYLSQIDESSGAAAQTLAGHESPTTPTVKRVLRNLSEPAHKSSVPTKPILKGVKYSNDSPHQSGQQSHPAAIGNNIPLDFASRKDSPPAGTVRTEEIPNSTMIDEASELFYLPGKGKADLDGSDTKSYVAHQGIDCNPETFYQEPHTPLESPPLRTSFSQPAYPNYPPTPRNTFRRKRKGIPIVDELDRLRSGLPFPSCQTFTFSPPFDSPSSSDFPFPPQDIPEVKDTPQTSPATGPTRRTSWRRAFSLHSQEKSNSRRPEVVRTATKRKSGSESELYSKRRKVVKFDLPPDHREHPPMRRRPTPYIEPFSSKVRRLFRELFAPFFKTKEEKELEWELKRQRKAEKRARREREELIDSFRHDDDLAD